MSEPNETRAAKPAVAYLMIYPALRDEALKHGYALAVHGSLGRDMDLIAVPWTEDASDGETLVKALCDVAGLYVRPPFEAHPEPSPKPHGRMAWTLIPGGPLFIDLSVMPKVAP